MYALVDQWRASGKTQKVFCGGCDMRKSFNGLSGLVHNELNRDPASGEVFVFLNRRLRKVEENMGQAVEKTLKSERDIDYLITFLLFKFFIQPSH